MSNQFNRTNTSYYEYLVQAISSHNSDECLIWPFGKDGKGYGRCRISGRRVKCHRVSFFVTYNRWPMPEGRHTCDNPACFNPRHVIEGTHRENMLDMKNRNRAASGLTHPRMKLTMEDVASIRRLYVWGSSTHGTSALAVKFGVGPTAINNIVLGKTRTHT